MFLRLLYQSFHRQRRSKLLAAVAVALGVAVATAMLAIGNNIGDKMNRELRSFGANILVTPVQDTLDVQIGGVHLKPAAAGAYLRESDLVRMKGIFFGHNILGFAPFLSVPTDAQTSGATAPIKLVGTYFAKQMNNGNESFTTGVRSTNPLWQVQGNWPDDGSLNQVLVGATLAGRLHVAPGQQITVGGSPAEITGVLRTGGDEESEIVAPLALAQQLAHAPNAVGSVWVSALTKPEDAFARVNPDSLSPAERERQYCSPYALTISRQIELAIPNSHAEQVRRVAQSEGQVLQHIQGLFWLLGLAAVIASILAVAASSASALMQRRTEIGLMKALGATRGAIASIFLAEGALIAAISALLGFALGDLLARRIGASVFGSTISAAPALFPFVLLIAFVVMMSGSLIALRRALRASPSLILREVQ